MATATGQAGDQSGGTNPAYVRHLMTVGRVVVAGLAGSVVGFGAVEQIGAGPDAVTMLCDLFVDPAAHGRGLGRAMLADLWASASRRMTFSSLHSHAVPLYTSFGLDAWWPLLYLHGPRPPGRAASPCSSAGTTRRSPRAWFNAGPDRGITHLAVSPATDDGQAAGVVLLALAQLGGAEGDASVCLPAPHPEVRALLAAGWRSDEFDLFMATDPELINPRRAVPSPAQA